MTHQNKTLLAFDAVNVGDALPAFDLPPVSRLGLALYCGASGDHNPIHVDIDFAKSAGMPDVFAHGMLSMAWLGRLLTNWVPQTALRDYSVRFAAITQVGERMSASVPGRFLPLLEKRLGALAGHAGGARATYWR